MGWAARSTRRLMADLTRCMHGGDDARAPLGCVTGDGAGRRSGHGGGGRDGGGGWWEYTREQRARSSPRDTVIHAWAAGWMGERGDVGVDG